MSSPKILVTGGTGFIGRYVVDRLRSQGIEPVVTTSSEPDAVANGSAALDLTDAKSTDRVISSIKPDIVLHLGGVTGAGTTAGLCDQVNFVGTVNLLQAVEKAGISRIVLLGTAAEYGDQKAPFREDMPARPVSPYAVSKAKANLYALELYAKAGLPVTILRVFSAYGYGQPRKMFLSQVITSALLGLRFNMSDGVQRRDLVFVEDVADAILAAMTDRRAVGRIINIAGGRAIALRDLATKVWDTCRADPKLLEIGTRDKASDDAFDTEADITLAAELLEWRPQTPFIADARPGHPLFEMIDRMRGDLDVQDAAVSVSGLPAQ
jgi:nucleoside-diphosphate-sugar epimerase